MPKFFATLNMAQKKSDVLDMSDMLDRLLLWFWHKRSLTCSICLTR